MAQNTIGSFASLPMGSKIKGWIIDGILPAGTFCHMYFVHNKNQRAIMKLVSILFFSNNYLCSNNNDERTYNKYFRRQKQHHF